MEKQMAKPRCKKPTVSLKVGDAVLVGSAYSKPGEWFVASVLWAGDEDFLSEHTVPSTHELHRQVLPLTHVRAVGDFLALHDFQTRCREACREHTQAVSAAERVLGEARQDLWDHLAAINAAEPVRFGEPVERENGARTAVPAA